HKPGTRCGNAPMTSSTRTPQARTETTRALPDRLTLPRPQDSPAHPAAPERRRPRARTGRTRTDGRPAATGSAPGTALVPAPTPPHPAVTPSTTAEISGCEPAQQARAGRRGNRPLPRPTSTESP